VFRQDLHPTGSLTALLALLALLPLIVLPDAAHGVWTFDWPGLHVLSPMGKPANTAYVLNYLGATGTLLFVSGLLTLIWLQSTPVLDWMVP
jgi:lactate permease